MGAREQQVSASLAVLNRGGPPLLGADRPYYKGIGIKHLYPVGITDDQGIYVWLPAIGHFSGERNPEVLMKWLFIGCFVLLLLVYPLLFFELLAR